MKWSKDTVRGTLLVAFLICLVCSLLVSVAAVQLRPQQQRNRLQDKWGNILEAAGIRPEKPSQISEVFKTRIERRYVDLESGQFVEESVVGEDYNELVAARDPKQSIEIPPAKDIAGIRRRARHMPVYLFQENGALRRLILPVYGRGLWSTLYGFLSLDADLNTVQSLGFYQHGETPGLGGEVDNPRWRAQWKGKSLFDSQGEVKLTVARGQAERNGEAARFAVDGLSGATITAQGVDHLVKYWMGPHGYGPMLDQLRRKGASR